MGFSVSWWLFYIGQLLICVGRSSWPSGGYQYAHSASIRSFSALATLASWFGYQCSCDAGVAAALTASPDAHILSVYRRSQCLQTPTTQRLQRLTASADAHSVSKRPQRINAPTAYDTHIFHSVSTRPQRINTPTALWRRQRHGNATRYPGYKRRRTRLRIHSMLDLRR